MRKAVLVLLILLGLSAPAAAGPLYVNLAQGELATVNPTTGVATVLNGGAGFNQFGDIAVSTSGKLFGYGLDNGNSGLVLIDPTNGTFTPIGAQNQNALNALAFSPTDTLFGANGTTLFTVDTSTGVQTAVGSFSGVGVSAGDLVFFNGNLYLSTTTGLLATLNPTTGAVIGSVPFGPTNTEVFGLAESNGQLLAFSRTSVFTLNPTTGTLTALGSGLGLMPAQEVFGAASAPGSSAEPPVTPEPIPEPASLAAFGALAACGLGYARRRLNAGPTA